MIMFEHVVESLRKATEANLAVQQEMFRKWTSLWPAMPAAPGVGTEQVQRYRKQWVDFAEETLKRQREVAQTQFKAGLDIIEKTFQLGEIKTAEELRTRTLDLWRQCFETIGQSYEAQAKEFQSAIEKWFTTLTTKVPA
jgi:hypothetical protein